MSCVWQGQGFLEKRGNNYRIRHHQGYNGNQRQYSSHKIGRDYVYNLGINGNQNMGINNPNSSSISENVAGGVGFEPTTPNLGGWCSIRTELPVHALAYSEH